MIAKEPRLSMRGCFASALGLSAVAWVLAAIACAAAVVRDCSWFPALGFVSLAVMVMAWVRSFRVVIRDGVLTYWAPLQGAIRTPLDEIEDVGVEAGTARDSRGFRPFFRLAIRTRPGSPTAPTDINIKVFARRDIAELLQVLERSPRPVARERS